MNRMKTKHPKDKKYLKPENPLKVFLSLFWFFLLLLPNYILAGIKCLTAKRKDIRGQVVMVRKIYSF